MGVPQFIYIFTWRSFWLLANLRIMSKISYKDPSTDFCMILSFQLIWIDRMEWNYWNSFHLEFINPFPIILLMQTFLAPPILLRVYFFRSFFYLLPPTLLIQGQALPLSTTAYCLSLALSLRSIPHWILFILYSSANLPLSYILFSVVSDLC